MPKTNIASPDDIETIRVPQAGYVKMTELRQFFVSLRDEISEHDRQALVPITGEPHMCEDVTRLGVPSRGADLRYRPDDQ